MNGCANIKGSVFDATKQDKINVSLPQNSKTYYTSTEKHFCLNRIDATYDARKSKGRESKWVRNNYWYKGAKN